MKITALLAVLAMLLSGVYANADTYPDSTGYLDDDLISELDDEGLDRPLVVQRTVNLALTGVKSVNISQILGLQQYRGLRVRAVTFQANSPMRASAELKINGYLTGDIRQIAGAGVRQIFRIDPTNNVLARDIRTLQLTTRGRLNLNRIGVILEGAAQHPMKIGKKLNKTFSGMGVVNLEGLLGLQRFNGMPVRSITLIASGSQGARADLCVYAYCLEQRAVGTSLRTIQFFPQGRIGVELDRLQFQLRGTVYVDSIVVELQNTGRVRPIVRRPVVRARPIRVPVGPGKPIPRPKPRAQVHGGAVIHFP